jgi:hypothetical protein
MAIAEPLFESAAATSSQASRLRDEMYTRAPASTKPRAILSPIPLEPPVTTATLPSIENRSFKTPPSHRSDGCFADGSGRLSETERGVDGPASSESIDFR